MRNFERFIFLVFKNYESTKKFNEIFLVSFKRRQNFSIEIKNVAKTVYFTKKRHIVAPLKEKKTFFVKKFCGFIDSEIVKISHEQVIIFTQRCKPISVLFLHQLCINYRVVTVQSRSKLFVLAYLTCGLTILIVIYISTYVFAYIKMHMYRFQFCFCINYASTIKQLLEQIRHDRSHARHFLNWCPLTFRRKLAP